MHSEVPVQEPRVVRGNEIHQLLDFIRALRGAEHGTVVVIGNEPQRPQPLALGREVEAERQEREWIDDDEADRESQPGSGAKMIRSAGSFGQLMAKEGDYAQIRMPSGEVRQVQLDCKATVGQLSNIESSSVRVGKAGKSRWKGIRPTVRGVVMNPVDHPHGGGEGKSGQGNPHPVSPWGWHTKGKKTRNSKRTDAFIVRRRK